AITNGLIAGYLLIFFVPEPVITPMIIAAVAVFDINIDKQKLMAINKTSIVWLESEKFLVRRPKIHESRFVSEAANARTNPPKNNQIIGSPNVPKYRCQSISIAELLLVAPPKSTTHRAITTRLVAKAGIASVIHNRAARIVINRALFPKGESPS